MIDDVFSTEQDTRVTQYLQGAVGVIRGSGLPSSVL